MTSKISKIPISGLKKPINDPFYRYIMDEPCVDHVKGKTAITNIDKIAVSLARPVPMIAKFFKSKFATSVDYKDGSLIIPSTIAKDAIQKAISSFIDEFVLCGICLNPETILEPQKKKTFLNCKACGKKTEI
jgi:translation initiation factor 2 beta subunit (eIF-2beta)/eIF-5